MIICPFSIIIFSHIFICYHLSQNSLTALANNSNSYLKQYNFLPVHAMIQNRLEPWKDVLISSGCVNRNHRLDGLKNKTFFFQSSRAQKSKVKILTNSVSCEHSFPGFQIGDFLPSCCVLPW